MDRLLSEEERKALLSLFQEEPCPEPEVPSWGGSGLVEQDSQRRFFRLQRHLPAVLELNGTPHPVSVLNISLGGVFISCPLDLPVGQRVELDIQLPSPQAQIRVTGFICWGKKSEGKVLGLGIKFSSLPTEAIWALIANIEEARKTGC